MSNHLKQPSQDHPKTPSPRATELQPVETVQESMELKKVIEERMRIEEKLRESETRFKTLVEHAADAFILHETNGKVIDVNQMACISLGYQRDELLELNMTDFDPNFVPEMHERMWKQITVGLPVTFESEYRRKDGSVFPVEVRLGLLEAGERRLLLALARDITIRKMADEALKQSNKRLISEYQQRKNLSKKLIELLEKDRYKIAMELHDHIGQIMTSLKIDIEMIRNKIRDAPPDVTTRLESAEKKTVRAIRSIKEISHGLMPVILDNLGLIASMRELVNDFKQQFGIVIHFFWHNIPDHLPREKALTIYRIVQESLNNVVKHALATSVHINLMGKDHMISLSIEDDGIGFEINTVLNNPKNTNNLGLHIMQERTLQVGGEFYLEPRKGGGAHILVEIPL